MIPTDRLASSSFAIFSLLVLTLVTASRADLVRDGAVRIDQTEFAELQDSGQFGESMAIGDFNCDGFGDVAFGSPWKKIGANGVGQVLVAYGSASGIPNGYDVVFEQGAALGETQELGDHFGSSLAVGNFDGAGCDDLAIGVSGESVDDNGAEVGDAGALHVLYGWQFTGGLTMLGSDMFHRGSTDMAWDPEPNVYFGDSMTAGDFNGDGYSDLAVGVAFDKLAGLAGAGSVHVIYGSSTGLVAKDPSVPDNHVITEAVLGSLIGIQHTFGWSLAACDFDGDGRDDLAVGAPFKTIDGEYGAGAFFVIPGSASGLDVAGGTQWDRTSPGIPGVAGSQEQFGGALAAADFDGDGLCDLAVGAPDWRDASNVDTGQSLVLFGHVLGLSTTGLATMNLPGLSGAAPDSIQFGHRLAAGDFDGDGRADLAVSATDQTVEGVADAGAVYIVGGRADRSFELRLTLDQSGDVPGAVEPTFGEALAAGDVDGDGRADLVVSNPDTDANAGAAIVFFSYGLFSDDLESGNLGAWDSVVQ